MGKKLLEKAGLIIGPHSLPKPLAATATTATTMAPRAAVVMSPEAPRPKTAPGAMLQFMSSQSGALQEIEGLREKVKEFEGACAVRKIDPREIGASRWANRHAASFADDEFLALRDEIREAGGVVQPIKVRPLAQVLNGSTAAADPAVRYEVVFGHRRHRACLDLGIPVLAMVEAVSDHELFQEMERENRQRKNLSAWEQGCMYRQAIDGGLYSSLRKLSEAIDVDVSLVSKAVSLARLPDAVVAAFASPLDIQFRWAAPLAEVVQKDPDGVLARARELKAGKAGELTPVQVFEALIIARAMETPQARQAATDIFRDGKKVAVLSTDASGRELLRFERGVLTGDRREQLLQWVRALVTKGEGE
jgi:ParB family transcriptional regulator, chromosome partitioning protein